MRSNPVNHFMIREEPRRAAEGLPKGTSFDGFTQGKANVVLSHMNSDPRAN